MPPPFFHAQLEVACAACIYGDSCRKALKLCSQVAPESPSLSVHCQHTAVVKLFMFVKCWKILGWKMTVFFLGYERVLSCCRPLMKHTGKVRIGGNAINGWPLKYVIYLCPWCSSQTSLSLSTWYILLILHPQALCWSRYRNQLSLNQLFFKSKDRKSLLRANC